jgi:hypothetical protein
MCRHTRNTAHTKALRPNVFSFCHDFNLFVPYTIHCMVYIEFTARHALTHASIHESLRSSNKSEFFLDCEAPALCRRQWRCLHFIVWPCCIGFVHARGCCWNVVFWTHLVYLIAMISDLRILARLCCSTVWPFTVGSW